MNTIEAGPELDAAVAVEVMGWTKMRQRRAGEWCGVPPESEAVYPVPFFSADIAAALGTLTKVTAIKGWSFTIESNPGYDSGPRYDVTIRHGHSKWHGDSFQKDDEGEFDDSLPLAICRAALAAVRANKGTP